MEAVRYVHRNPLELSMAGGLAAYRWSSHAAYVGRAPRPRWLTCATLIELTGGDRPAFRAYVEGERASDARMVDRWGSQHLVDLVAIDQVVSQILTQDEMVQVSDRVRPRLGRDLALVLAIDHRRASPAELAAHHGLARRSSVWSAVGRTRRRAESDATVRRLLERCRDAIEVSTLGA